MALPTPPWYLVLLYGANPLYWSTTAHRFTGWKYWTPPVADRVNCPKRHRVAGTTLTPFPTRTFARRKDGTAIVCDISEQTFDAGRPEHVYNGWMSGVPMQNGLLLDTGIGSQRRLSWGSIQYGEKFMTQIPKPANGFYWVQGYPAGLAFDQIACLRDPVTGDMHELIGFNPGLASPDDFAFNQAIAWSRWHNGNLIAGKPASAARISVSSVVWTPWSKLDPHQIGLHLGDYVGADGALTDGVHNGATLLLNTRSASFQNMMAKGGECAELATAMAIEGLYVRDRSGYNDTGKDADGDPVPGYQPKGPAIDIQPSAYWRDTNILEFRIALTDLFLET